MDWDAIGARIAATTGTDLPKGQAWPVGGGDINSAFRYEAGGQAWFVKLNRSERLPMFEAEAAGLALLAQPGGPRVPTVITSGQAGDYAFLVLEYIPLKAADAQAQALLGAGQHHRHHAPGQHPRPELATVLACCMVIYGQAM